MTLHLIDSKTQNGIVHESGLHPSLPLIGRTVLITRSAEGNSIEKSKLEKLGAKVAEFASIKISPPSSWARCDLAISMLDKFDWIVFTSASGVHSFFKRCKVNPDAAQVLGKLKGKTLSSKPRFACIGPSTKHALEENGFQSSFEPTEFLTSVLAKELTRYVSLAQQSVLLARAQGMNNAISGIMESAGAQVTEVPVYRTELQQLALSSTTLDKITDVTLTSPSTVEALVKSISAGQINARQILVHCIGPVTAKRAEQKGLRVASVASVHTLDGLLDSVVNVAITKRKKLA